MKPFASTIIRKDSILLLLAIAAYVAVAMSVNNNYYQLIFTLVPIWATLAVSWNIFSGYSGLSSFGHAAFFGIGAFTVGLFQVKLGVAPWLSIPCAAFIGAVSGLAIGMPVLRLRSHYFGLSMLTFPLVLMYLAQYFSLQELPLVRHADAPIQWMQFSNPKSFTLGAMVILSMAMAVAVLVENSRFGLALTAIRENELAAGAAGIDTWRVKMMALSLSAAVAAVAGGYYTVVLLVVTPEAVFGMMVSAQALILTLFGGIANIWGPLAGSIILVPLAEILHAKLGEFIPGIQGVVYGLAIVGVTLTAPEGLLWRIRDSLPARFRRSDVSTFEEAGLKAGATAEGAIAAPRQQGDAGQTILCVRDLSKSFGGVKALQDVSFDVRAQEILGIIGPNGAGKTTLFNVLNGVTNANAGTAMLGGRDLLKLKLHQVCRCGVGRTFQVVRSFPRLTVLDNVLAGGFGRSVPAATATAYAFEALTQVGLADIAGRQADRLNQKELRLMELARAIAPKPRLLFLDEPLAGLGREESAQLTAVLRRLASDGMTIVIIEHTMHVLLKLTGRLVVLDHGQVIADAEPRSVIEDSKVIEAYLGSKWLKK